MEERRDRISGVLASGSFWYWKEPLNKTAIALRRARNRIQAAIMLLIALVTVASFALFAYAAATSRVSGFDVAFWNTPNASLVPFWFGVLMLQFLFYWWVRTRRVQNTLPSAKEGAALEVVDVPSIDVIDRKRDIVDALSEEGVRAVEEAYSIADKLSHEEVGGLHLFAGASSSQSAAILFMRLGLTFAQLQDAIRRRLESTPKGRARLGYGAQRIIATAVLHAAEQRRSSVNGVDLLIEAYRADAFLQELFYSFNVETEELEDAVAWIRINETLRDRYNAFRKAASFKPRKNMNRAYTAVATPFLDRVSEDLTRAAVYGRLPLLVGREREMNDLLRSIEGGRQSVVLTGSPGVGKRAIALGLAEKMAAEDVPKILQDKRLVRLDIPVIVSSQGGSGAEERLLIALQEVGMSGNIILVIEDIHQLVGQSGGGVDLSSVLAGELDKGYTFVIATTTPQGYGLVERSVLAQKLQKIVVNEPSRREAIQILESKMGGIENTHKVVFTFEALAALIDFSVRYMHDTHLPEKAILLAEEVGLEVAKRGGGEWTRVVKEDVARIVSEKTNIPVTEVTQQEGEKLLGLEAKMHERVIGQEEAVNAVAAALRRARAELRAENRPIANFLFLGPTGVGKTETAKTTAEVYFGSENAMLRFDMSEYQDKVSIYRLIGGTGETGLLTEAVRKNPFSLVLLDELEKAHPDILNLFLQVMDDGRLTDGEGRTVDFTNVILIATSNAGTQFIQDAVATGTPMEQVKEALMNEQLKQVYRPEFLNRFDGVVVFKPLAQEDVVAIAYLMIRQVAARLEAKGISFRASDEAVHELALRGFDPKFGARPLRRVIQETVDNAIAEILLRGEVGRRDTLILEPNGAIQVEKAEAL